MRRGTSRSTGRCGAAAVEFAIVMPFLTALMVGVWEVGRVLMVTNVVTSAAYEGARLSASAGYWSSSNYTDPITGLTLSLTYSQDSSGNPISYDVQKRVITYLTAAGINTTGATVKVQNISQNWSATWSYNTGSTSSSGTSSGGYDPAAVANAYSTSTSSLDHLRVTVQLPYSSVQWSTLALFIPNSYTVSAVVDVYSVRNIPFSVSTTIPQSVQ